MMNDLLQIEINSYKNISPSKKSENANNNNASENIES